MHDEDWLHRKQLLAGCASASRSGFLLPKLFGFMLGQKVDSLPPLLTVPKGISTGVIRWRMPKKIRKEDPP